MYKMTRNFVKADSTNLPKVDVDMVLGYLSGRDVYMAPEMRGVKEARSGRQSYGDSAVGYVGVSREGSSCIVTAKICPEHRVTSAQYVVETTVDESKEEILNASCLSCKAAKGGCKHTVAFLMWLQRRTEEPSPTSTVCYWEKSVLARSGGKDAIPVKLKDFGSVPQPLPEDPSFLQDLLAAGDGSSSMLHRQFLERPAVEQLSMHYVLCKSRDTEFNEVLRKIFTPQNCDAAEKATQGQIHNALWRQLRYGRVTASKFYEVAHCRTPDGFLVNSILGLVKVRDNKAMERGRLLEDPVLERVTKALGLKWRKTGVFFSAKYPWLAASPDGLSDEFVLEVKCPTKASTVKNFITNTGGIQPKYYAQIQCQMLLCRKLRGVFCVADPNFELSNNLITIVVDYNAIYMADLLRRAELFWESAIMPRMIDWA